MSIARFNVINSDASLVINDISTGDIDLCNGGGNVIVRNNLNINGNIATPLSVSTGANANAFSVGTVVNVDTIENTITASKLFINGSSSGSPGVFGKLLDTDNVTFTDNSTAGSGTATSVNFNTFRQPTLAATNTDVTTVSSSTLFIQGAPLPGTNQTITDSYALRVNSGITRLDDKLLIGVTDADSISTSGGITITNTTDAVSSTNGGTFTTPGGAAIGKKLFVGDLVSIKNATISSTLNDISINANGDTVKLRNASGSANGEFESSSSIFKFRNGDNTANILEINKTSGLSTFSGKINITNTATDSISTSGGITITNTTDATNVTTGGTFTTPGGAAIAKKLFVGGLVTVSNGINMVGTKITNTIDPSLASDVATKNYVDSVAKGLNVKQAVRVATTDPGTLSTSFENGDVIDGITITTGDRILIKDQADGIENGIYIVQATGAPVRASDFDAGSAQRGSFTFVSEGATKADSGYVVTNDDPNDIVGTNALTFTQFSGAGVSANAGTGLTKIGDTLHVNEELTHVTAVGTLTSLDVSPGNISGTSMSLSGLTPSQAVFTDASKNLVSVATTGSGNAVLQTSPTLITPVIGAATGTSLSLSGNLSSVQGIFSGDISIKNTSIKSTLNDVIINANGDTIKLRNTDGSANGEFESSSSIFKFRNGDNTSNILEINKTSGLSTFTGKVSISNTVTDSISTAGGITITNTTDATSVTTGGSFTTSGGMAVGKKLFVGDTSSFQVAGTVNTGLTMATFKNTSEDRILVIDQTATLPTGISTSTVNGLGLYSRGTGSLNFYTTSGNTIRMSISSSGIVNITNSTSSTSNTTGALTLLGGISTSNTTDAVSSTNGGSCTLGGGASIAKKLFVGTSTTIGNTSYSSGMLNVLGADTIGLIRVLPSVNGESSSIAFFKNADGSNTVAGDYYKLGTEAGIMSVSTSSDTALQIHPNSNSVVIGGFNKSRSYNVLSFGGVPGDNTLADTSVFSSLIERNFTSSENKFNNPSVSGTGTSDSSELVIYKGGEAQDRVRVLSNSFCVDVASASLAYNSQTNVIDPSAGTIKRTIEVSNDYSVNIINSTGNAIMAINPSSGDIIKQVSFSGVNNQATPANVTGLSFDTTKTRSFTIQMSVVVNATASKYAQFTIEGIYNGTSWYFVSNYIGDDTTVTFSITSLGSVQYTSGNYPGFSSLTFKFRAQTIDI